jgi:hypothetical protein
MHTGAGVAFSDRDRFQGQMTFLAGDGTEVVIDSTSLYFGDDVGSKGHHSRNSGRGMVCLVSLSRMPAGQGPALSAMIQFQGDYVGSGACWPSRAKWFGTA